MYEIVSVFNSIIRDKALPNPFQFMFENQIIAILFSSLFGAKLLNDIAYTMCGVFYKSRSNKVLGSIEYMFFYYINVEILIKLRELFKNVNLIFILYTFFVISMFWILNKIKRVIRNNII